MQLRTNNCSLSDCWILFKLKNEDMSLMEEEMTVPPDSCLRQAKEFVTLTALLMLLLWLLLLSIFSLSFFSRPIPWSLRQLSSPDAPVIMKTAGLITFSKRKKNTSSHPPVCFPPPSTSLSLSVSCTHARAVECDKSKGLLRSSP